MDIEVEILLTYEQMCIGAFIVYLLNVHEFSSMSSVE